MADRYEPEKFEAKWRRRWQDANLFATRLEPDRPKFYGLDFFPYPSGAGLSVGHCSNYVPTDVICRMKFMQGHNVLHPMGFDAFGLPAENEAIKRRIHPARMVEQYGANYRRQMELIGVSYDWSRCFYSSDPRYYRWTQWIFTELFRKGLAYRALGDVNWCPEDKTALANEEVVGGLCERCGTPVERRTIPQWYFRITDYAQRLLEDLDELDWPEGIKAMQRNWIGRSEGVEFAMRLAIEGPSPGPDENGFEWLNVPGPPIFRVFTTRIDTIFGMTFCALSPEHPLTDALIRLAGPERREAMEAYRAAASRLGEATRLAADREKTGVHTGFDAINPATGGRVPVYLADYVMMGYGTGAIMAVPGHDQRDLDFARKHGIPVVPVIAPRADAEAEVRAMHAQGQAYEAKDGVMINSGEYTGLTVAEGQWRLGEWMEALGIGERKVSYRLRDWLISRQRYWGCPIPIVHDKDGDENPVPLDMLPVLLPDVESYEPSGDGQSPLAAIPEFVNVADSDGTLGRRETDTMGGFACSSWYFLRFCDPHNDERAWSPEAARYWMPVDCYVGGAEHAVMHLLYSRFWTKVLYDLGHCPVKEPFQRLMNQGQVLARTPYRKAREGERLEVGEEGILVSFEEAERLPPEELTWRWVRMSKSKGNVVTPDEAVEQFGADALRLCLLFVAPFEADVQWSSEAATGLVRFLHRVFRLVAEVKPAYDRHWRDRIELSATSEAARCVRRHTHQTIAKVTADIERFALNTYVSSLMVFVNDLNDAWKARTEDPGLALAFSEAIESLVLMLAPGAPFSADELWESLGHEGFTYRAPWPKADAELAKEDLIEIAVQVNGKLRDTVMVAAGAGADTLERLARASEKVRAHTAGKTIRKVIVVPDRIVNVVVG
jgi:leucyl-tRNA synthetase